MNNTIRITKQEYVSLLKDRAKLMALEGGGVDNWQGYDDSLNESYEKEIANIEKGVINNETI